MSKNYVWYSSSEEEDDDNDSIPAVNYQKSAVFALKKD